VTLDGLRQEFFPQVAALARRIPNPRFARANLLWSVLAAYGIAFFVEAALTVFFSLVFRLFGAAAPAPVLQLAAAAAAGSALAVAWRAGGRDAVTVYATVFILEQALALPGMWRFCLAIVSATPTCSLGSWVLGFWPQVLGVGLAVGLARWFRTSDAAGNPLLEPAGALALTQSVLGSVLAALLLSATSLESGIIVILAAVAGGIACGLVVLRRVPAERQWPAVGVIAIAAIGTWAVVNVPQLLQQIGIGGTVAIGGLGLLGALWPFLQIGAAALVLYLDTARRVSAEPA
jgi:hypothetical protein